MHAGMTEGELRVKLSSLTRMSEEEWSDVFWLRGEAQALALANYAAASWVQDRDVLADVLKVLEVLGTIAGVASGVGGAYQVLRSL